VREPPEPRLILATFKDQAAADEGLARIRQAAKEKRVDVRAAAVVSQDGGSRVRIHDVSDFRSGQIEPLLQFIRLWNGVIVVSVKAAGTVAQSLTALAVLGAVRAVGAADLLFSRLARLAGRSPLRSGDLQQLGYQLPAGATAVVTLADAASADAVRRLMEQSGASVHTSGDTANGAAANGVAIY
jgi:hypothetical protein